MSLQRLLQATESKEKSCYVQTHHYISASGFCIRTVSITGHRNEKCFIILNQVILKKASKSINALSHAATSDGGSGDYGGYITDSRIKDDDGFDVDDSDYDIFIEEVGFCDVSD